MNFTDSGYYSESMQMLKEHSDLFEAIAKGLLDNESLGKAELDSIVERYNG